MKHPNTLSKEKTGLLVIDVQDKFSPVIPDFDEMVHNITKLILTFQMFKMPVIVTEQYPKGLGNTVQKIRRQFKFLEVVEKLELACTGNTHFWAQLNPLELETIVVCGIETHVCVNQTVLGLLYKGYKVHLIADAIGTRSKLDHDIGIQKMIQAGALLSSTEMCLFELVEKAGTQSFKYIQKMVKSKINKESQPSAELAKIEDVDALVKDAEAVLENAPEDSYSESVEKSSVESVEIDEVDDVLNSIEEDHPLDEGVKLEQEHASDGEPERNEGEAVEIDESMANAEDVDALLAEETVPDDTESVEDLDSAGSEPKVESVGASLEDGSGSESIEVSDSDINDLMANEDENKEN